MGLAYTSDQVRVSPSDIHKRFYIAQDEKIEGVPADKEEKLAIQTAVRSKIAEAAVLINNEIADSRTKSVALTELESALMWAGKAIFE